MVCITDRCSAVKEFAEQDPTHLMVLLNRSIVPLQIHLSGRRRGFWLKVLCSLPEVVGALEKTIPGSPLLLLDQLVETPSCLLGYFLQYIVEYSTPNRRMADYCKEWNGVQSHVVDIDIELCAYRPSHNKTMHRVRIAAADSKPPSTVSRIVYRSA